MQKETYVASELQKQEPLQDITANSFCNTYGQITYEGGGTGNVEACF